MGALTRPALSSFGRQDTLPEGMWGSVSSGSGYAVAISGPAQFLWPQCPQYCHSEKAAWLSPRHHISVRTSEWIPPTPSAPSSPWSCLKLSTTNFAGIFCPFSVNGFSKAFLSIELPLSTNYVSVVAVVQLLSRVQLFATPRTAAHHAPLSFTISQSLLKFISIESVMLRNHLILCRPLLPSIFPSLRVFSNESALPIRWLNYWSFSYFSTSQRSLKNVGPLIVFFIVYPDCYY